LSQAILSGARLCVARSLVVGWRSRTHRLKPWNSVLASVFRYRSENWTRHRECGDYAWNCARCRDDIGHHGRRGRPESRHGSAALRSNQGDERHDRSRGL